MPTLIIGTTVKRIEDKTMKRDEEIWNAIFKLRLGEHSDDDSLGNDEYSGDDLQNAFYSGAKWADSNPKSLWISVKEDLPCNHEELIRGTKVSEGTETIEVFARNEYGDIWDDYMVYEDGKWRWNDFEPAYWMIAPKLPQEKEIKL